MATTRISRPTADRSVVLPDLSADRTKPLISYWAAAGVFFLGLQLFIFGSWIGTGKAERTPNGPTAVPGWMSGAIVVLQVVSLALAVIFLYKLVIQPWRRDGRLGLDGLMCLAFATCYWQDPLSNYVKYWAIYNPAAFNLGSWAANIPGWLAPHGNNFAEPILWALPAYFYVAMGGAMLGCWVMRQARARRPSLLNWHLVAICYGFMVVFDIAIEFIWMRMGAYAYIAVPKGITFFKGKYFQFPLSEALLFGAFMTAITALRFFLDDKGRTIAERGDGTRRSRYPATKRFLALAGILNVMYLGTYNIPMNWVAMHSDYSPPDITNRSYFTNGLCGPGTEYLCGGKGPINTRGGKYHVDHEGNFHRNP